MKAELRKRSECNDGPFPMNEMPLNSFAVVVSAHDDSCWEPGHIVYRTTKPAEFIHNISDGSAAGFPKDEYTVRPLRDDEEIVITK